MLQQRARQGEDVLGSFVAPPLSQKMTVLKHLNGKKTKSKKSPKFTCG